MTERRTPDFEPSWLAVMGDAFDQAYMRDLRAFLVQERRSHTVYPAASDIFAAFWATPFERVRVVILGQDPYIGPGQAHGLSFSVRPGVPTPPSLFNILKEARDDVGIPPATHGCLSHWAKQGVLLLNAVLTVRAGQSNSHAGQGWEQFTDRAISELNTRRDNLVFLLWGEPAKRKAARGDRSRHHVLPAPHPSPLSAHRGFLGCRHFSQTNAWLTAKGLPPIDWSLPPLVPGEHLGGRL